jgi:hypothetical protein
MRDPVYRWVNLPLLSGFRVRYDHHPSDKKGIDYCLSSLTQLTRGIWMSFFDTEEAHAVMLAYAADKGGRAALKVTSTSLNL